MCCEPHAVSQAIQTTYGFYTSELRPVRLRGGCAAPFFGSQRGMPLCNANALQRAFARVRLKRNARLCPCKQAKPSRPFRVTKKGECHPLLPRRRALCRAAACVFLHGISMAGGAVPAPRPLRPPPRPAHFAPAPIPRPAPHRRRGHGDNKSMLYDAKRFDFENNLFRSFLFIFS